MASLLPEIPEELLLEIYRDLAKPGIQQVGQAIGGILSILNLTTIPFRMFSGKASIWLEHNLEKYRDKMAGIDPAKVIEVPPEIAAPIIQKMTYTTCDELGEMFANLLKNASTREGETSAHPNFVNIISSISRDEAIILEDKHKGVITPSLFVKQTFKSGRWVTPIMIHTHYYYDGRLSFPQNDEFYHTNLENLGLLYKSQGELSSAPYGELRSAIQPRIDALKTEDTTNIELFNQHLGLTAIGKLFLQAVYT